MTKHTSREKTFDTVKKTMKYFFPIAWKTQPGYFLCEFSQMILSALSPFVKIMMTPLIIDELLSGRDISRLMLYAAVIVLGDATLNMIISSLNITMEKYSEKFENYFTEQLSRRIMELDFQLTEDKSALDQIEKAREGMSWYSGGVSGICQQFFTLISACLTVAGTIVLIFVNAPVLCLLTAILLIIKAVVNNKNNKIELESYRHLSKVNRIFSYLGWEVTDFRYGKDIRLYDAADMMAEKWKDYSREELRQWQWEANKRLPWSLLSAVADTATDFGMYLYLGALVILGKITIGTFSQMLATGAAFQSGMQEIITSMQEIVKRTNYAYEYVKFMDYPAAIKKGSRKVQPGPHTLKFRNVTFSYPNTDVKVLDGVNITLKQGEHLSIVGLNGAGKTTFIKLLCRLYDPGSGEILLDGVNIKDYDYNEYMTLFAPVFQDFKLFAFSVRDNIVLDGECSGQTLNHLLEQVGIAEKVNSFENGANTILFKSFNENGVEPSGGEQQKIAIARALYKKSPVVILDEPTAALDPVAEYDIYRQFNTLVGGKTAIYISHRLSSCKFCDKIAVFSEGKIKEYGTHDELVTMTDGIYAEMFKAQAHYYN